MHPFFVKQIVVYIRKQITRLKADPTFDSHSGLMVKVENNQIVVLDDYASIKLSNPLKTLRLLRKLNSIDWYTEDDNYELKFLPIWQALKNSQ